MIAIGASIDRVGLDKKRVDQVILGPFWTSRSAAAEIFRRRRVVVFSPNCSPADLYTRFPRNVIIRNKWDEVLEELKDRKKVQTVAIFPTALL